MEFAWGGGELQPACMNCFDTGRMESMFEGYICCCSTPLSSRAKFCVGYRGNLEIREPNPEWNNGSCPDDEDFRFPFYSAWHRLCHRCAQKDAKTYLIDMGRNPLHHCYHCGCKSPFVACYCHECGGWVWYTKLSQNKQVHADNMVYSLDGTITQR